MRDHAENSEIGIGFSSSSVPLDNLPGLILASWGYHGDDGYFYEQKGGQGWGPKFGASDVVGCCISFQESLIFYTKNGKCLDAAFKRLTFKTPNQPEQNDIYPTIRIRSNGERVHVNFGKEPFVFDIVKWMEMKSLAGSSDRCVSIN